MGRIIKIHERYVDLLQTRSRTEKFWLQYQRYVNILKYFIRVGRTGNLSLHLQSMSNLFILFPATGHINHAKCARPSNYVATRNKTTLGLLITCGRWF